MALGWRGLLLLLKKLKRYGQSALFALQCSSCKKKTYLQTAKHDGGAWTPQVAMDINKRLVYAACETGIGREGMATICDILNMPQPMTSESWNGHVNSLYDVHKNELQNNLQAARTKLRKKLRHETDDMIDVSVTYDGTLSKQGHTANFGFAFVISVDTGEAFDLDFMSKLCWECNNQNMVKGSEEFQQWFDNQISYPYCL